MPLIEVAIEIAIEVLDLSTASACFTAHPIGFALALELELIEAPDHSR